MNFDQFSIPENSKATLVSLVCENFPGHTNDRESQASFNELKELLHTLGVVTGSMHMQRKKQVEAATLLGAGKLKEIAEVAKAEGSHILVFDFELSATQVRNIREATGMEVVDRCSVILEIFAKHARTKEAKIQIEISRLQYLLPRLSGLWAHFGRQRGGVGVRGGEGEQQLELDRRIVRERIEFLKRQLVDVQVARKEQRKRRQHKTIVAALIGYTNAGKSSLMNRLCQEEVLEENKLFATLDSTFRTLTPDSRPPLILVDTVGFISNLPATLVNGFKTTLESALEADLLLLVCDLSDQNFEKHLEVTERILKELGLDKKEKLIVFNKCDLVEDPYRKVFTRKRYPESVFVSSLNREDMKYLRDYIINFFLDKQAHYDLFIPYEDGEAHSKIMSSTNIMNRSHHDLGTFYRIRTPDFIFSGLGVSKYLLQPGEGPLSLQ